MALTFTWNAGPRKGTVYTGFNAVIDSMPTSPFVAVAKRHNRAGYVSPVDVWHLDDDKAALAELHRMYAEQDPGATVTIALFKRQ